MEIIMSAAIKLHHAFSTSLLKSLLACILLTCSISSFATPANPIYVDTYATSGDGSQGSPWKGWDSAITWSQGKTYLFRAGWYGFDQAITQWTHSDIALVGEPNTTLIYTGTGPQNPVDAVISLDASGLSTPGINNVVMENFTIDGNGQALDGLYINQVFASRFRNIRIRGVSQTGFDLVFNVLNTFINPRISESSGVKPAVMMRMDSQAGYANNFCSANTIINPVFENSSTSTGFEFHSRSSQNTIIGGTVEGVGTGISLCTDGTYCAHNTFINTDLECNTTADIVVAGSESNQFNNVIAISNPSATYCGSGYSGPTTAVQLTSASNNNQFIGGQYASILERGQNNSFINIGTDWTKVDSYKIKTAFINVRDLNDASSRTLLPTNTSIGQSAQFLQNLFSKSFSGLSFSAPPAVPGVSTQTVTVGTSNVPVSGGAVIVSYSDTIPDNFSLDGYLDPSNPTHVIIRWRQISGTAQTPPSGGAYKVVILQ